MRLDDGAGGVEGDALADAGEYVGEIAVGGPRVTDPSRGHHGQPQTAREVGPRSVAVFLGAQPVALQLDVQSPWEETVEMLELAPGGFETAMDESLGDDTLGTA